MRAITSDVMLSAWEQAYGLGVVAKGVTLLSLAQPYEPLSSLLTWPIGARDGALLGLRAHLFGQNLKSISSCPSCQEQVELDFRVDDIRIQAETSPATEFEVVLDEQRFSVRLPNSADLLAIQDLATHQQRRHELLRRCSSREEDSEQLAEISEAASQDLVQRMAERDPQADIRLAMDCPSCSKAWTARFDIVTYLWKELDIWAQRLLADVHLLASTYGWHEREIVALSPWRRQIYLEMLRR